MPGGRGIKTSSSFFRLPTSVICDSIKGHFGQYVLKEWVGRWVVGRLVGGWVSGWVGR